MTALSRIDSSALNRALVGFDGFLDSFERRFASQLQNNYPPHNVIKVDENNYTIELAVAGFDKDEITVEVENDTLTIKGECLRESKGEFLHRGLSMRNFTRQFQLAEHVVVKGAFTKNGILAIQLERIVPEEKKPRIIDIIDVN